MKHSSKLKSNRIESQGNTISNVELLKAQQLSGNYLLLQTTISTELNEFKERVKDYEKRRRIESTNDSQISPTDISSFNPKVQLPLTKSTSNVTPNSIVSLIAHDIRITPMGKERINNYIYNKTKIDRILNLITV